MPDGWRPQNAIGEKTTYQGLPGWWVDPQSMDKGVVGFGPGGPIATFQVDPSLIGTPVEGLPEGESDFAQKNSPEVQSLFAQLHRDLLSQLLLSHEPESCPAGGAGSGPAGDFFGNGSDGDVRLLSDTTAARDMFYNNLWIASGVTLNPNGFVISVRKELTLESGAKISASGGAGGAGSGATGGAAGTAGGATVLRPYLAIAGAGGAGGTSGGSGTTAGTGGAAGTGVARVQNGGPMTLLAGCGGGGGGYLGSSAGATNAAAGSGSLGANGGAGGAAVFSSGTPSLGGGAGGGGGGVVAVYAFVVNNAGELQANGGAGGSGQTSGANKSGNGSGGAGGAVFLYYARTSGGGVGTLAASGGAAGSGGNGGSAGSAGRTASVQVTE